MGRDGCTGLAVLAASLFLLWGTLGLERHPMVPVGPAFYPRLVLGITAALALALLAWDVHTHRRRRSAAPATAPEARNHRLVVVAFAIFTAYVLALPWLGFRVATVLFVVAFQAALEPPASPRRWALAVILAVVTTAAAYLAFEQYLKVLLPRGRWTGF